MAIVMEIADAQTFITGIVMDAETKEPIIGATITDAKHNKALTVTQTDGSFSIPNNDEMTLRITSIAASGFDMGTSDRRERPSSRRIRTSP